MRSLGVCGACCLAAKLIAATKGLTIADFDGPDPLSGWTFSRDAGSASATGSLTIGPGHTGQGAVLEYDFACRGRGNCGGSVAAVWRPAKPLKAKHSSVITMWIRAAPEVKVALLVTDPDNSTRRYPCETVTLENAAEDWRQVSIPLGAKSGEDGDGSYIGPPPGRIQTIAIVAESHYPQAVRGSVGFDDIALLDSSDQSFVVQPAVPVIQPPPDSGQLARRLGINVHGFSDPHLLDMAQQTGFQFVRADLFWRQAERNGGYRFVPYDRLLNALEARGMSVLWILDYGHPQHGGDRPRSPEDVAAYARYAEAVAAHFKGHNVRYEIWNEPNMDRFWPPYPDPAGYAILLREAVAAIRRVDPGARIVTGGVSRVDLAFLERMIEAGGAAQVNALGVHPYRRAVPETVASELAALRQLVKGKLGPQAEVWDTEWGYASYDYFSKDLRGDGHSPAGRKRQAVLACREVLTVWALGVPVAVWYDLRDDGPDGKNPEHNYGLLDGDNESKPAMAAIRQLTHMAGSHTYAGLISDAPAGFHAMRLDSTADRVFVVWNELPDTSMTVRFPKAGFVDATDLAGQPLKTRIGKQGNGEIAVPEGDGPIYIRFSAR